MTKQAILEKQAESAPFALTSLKRGITELSRISHPFSGDVEGSNGLGEVIGRLLPYLGSYTVEDAALLLGAVNVARALESYDNPEDEWFEGHEPLRFILEMFITAGPPASERCILARKYWTTGKKVRTFSGLARNTRLSDQEFLSTGSFPPTFFRDLEWVDDELKAMIRQA